MRPERSWLFCPADRPERFERALASGADRVVLDLEDAVLPAAKGAARAGLATWLDARPGPCAVVRVNAAGTPWHEDDLAALLGRRGLAGVMLPKSDDPALLGALADRLGGQGVLVALVETVRAMARLREVAAVPGLHRLAFGSVDFCLEAGIRGYGEELNAVRTQLVLACALAGLAGPIEGVTMGLKDPALLEQDVDRARRFGFSGKLCIHPAQVGPVNRGLSPSETEIGWARRVVAACAQGGGAIVVDGKLVDRPVRLQAEAILGSLA